MLPAYIIEEILKREKDNWSREEVYIERPDLDPPFTRDPNESDDEQPEDMGIAIIDFTL